MGAARPGMNPEALKGAPFEWGQTDCVCITYRWIDWIFGTDLCRLVINRYHDEDSAYLRQREIHPAVPIRDAGFSLFANPPERSGDVLIGRRKQFASMGFVWRGLIWSSAPRHGVVAVPVGRWRLLDWGWHVCRMKVW